MRIPLLLVTATLTFTGAGTLPAQDGRGGLLGADRAEASAGAWIYNDLPRGFAEAARTGKPLLAVFR